MTKGGAINPSRSAERDSGVGEQGSDLRACRDQTMSDVSTAASSTNFYQNAVYRADSADVSDTLDTQKRRSDTKRLQLQRV